MPDHEEWIMFSGNWGNLFLIPNFWLIDLLSKSVFNEVRDEFSKRLHTTDNVNWHTFPKFAKELADYGTRFEKEKDEKAIFAMAGSGFASTVRLAKSSPAMWTPIFKQNQENILEVLGEYISNLEEFKMLLEQKDFHTIYNKMQQTNAIKAILTGIN